MSQNLKGFEGWQLTRSHTLPRRYRRYYNKEFMHLMHTTVEERKGREAASGSEAAMA